MKQITQQTLFDRAKKKANDGDDRDLCALNSMSKIEVEDMVYSINNNGHKPDNLMRFTRAVASTGNVNLAKQWNRILDENDRKNTPLGQMLAKTTWLLSLQQSENHNLMIEFLQTMKTKTT